MNSFDVNNVAFNLTLFKRLGYYQIFSTYSPRVFNCNAYRLGLVVFILPSLCFNTFYSSIGFFADLEDKIEDTKLLEIIFLFLNYYLSVFKLLMCVYNANKIWDLLDVTRINFITSPKCFKHISILHTYRTSSIKITNFLINFIIITLIVWLIFPLLVNNVFNSKSNDQTTQRLENIGNFRYPMSIEMYNHYYYYLYFMEFINGVVITYGIIVIDFLLISISYVFIAQYEIHKTAFSCIGEEEEFLIKNSSDNEKYYKEFISVVIDQQNLNSKLKSYYSIVWPIIALTVAVTSGSIILLSYSSVMIFMASEYVPILNIIKLGSAFFFLCLELFTHCYLFERIQIKKDDVNFGVYSSNWTAMDFKFRKTVLFIMRMNDANHLMMNFTQQKVVNLQFFANVVLTCYNTVSVILKTRMQNIENID